MVQNANITGFAEKTPVLMADGTWKNIELIKEGDMVLSFDPSIPNAELEPRKVKSAFSSIERDCLEVLFDNRVTIAAKDQLFFTSKSTFKPCFETKNVMTYDGVEATIQTRKVRSGKWKIFDIEVEGNHTLVANGMRVHNKGSSKKVVSGKVGVPLTVSTTTRSGTTTVSVYPPPEQSARIVSNNGRVNLGYVSVPGVPIEYNPPAVEYFPPYPSCSYIQDRVRNADSIRNAVCDDMLDRKLVTKRGNIVSRPAITSAERATWKSQLSAIEAELIAMRTVPVQLYVGPHHGGPYPTIYSDPTLIQAALNDVAALKNSVGSAKYVDYFFTQARCNSLNSLLNRIEASVKYRVPKNPCERFWHAGERRWIVPCLPHPMPPIVIVQPCLPPAPTNYVDAKIYQNDPNFNYFNWVDTTCRYEFHPPGASVAAQTYYKHFDSSRNMYYYDRIKDGEICPAGVETVAAA